MRHYTPIHTGIGPEVQPHVKDAVIELTLYYVGGGQTTVPMPLRYAKQVSASIDRAVSVCRNYATKGAPS